MKNEETVAGIFGTPFFIRESAVQVKALEALDAKDTLCECGLSDSAGVTTVNGRHPVCGRIFVGSRVKELEALLAQYQEALRVKDEALILVLPLAKGYAYQNPSVLSNKLCIEAAEKALAHQPPSDRKGV